MNPPHWPQRRPGFGAGLTDFAAYAASDPNFAAAWGRINGQLNIEGADTSQINLAKTSLVNSFEQMANNLGVTGDQAISAAEQFVVAGQTIVGAANTVEGLIQTAETGSLPQITQAFTGVMVSVAIAAGAVSAGIGAAIVAGVGAVLGALQSLGLFGEPGSVQICGWSWNPAPDLVVGCLGLYVTDGATPRNAPGSVAWRSFPSEANPADAAWFEPTIGRGDTVTWNGLRVQKCVPRAIDRAYPDYQYGANTDYWYHPDLAPIGKVASIGKENTALPGDFVKMFTSAWRGNAEYALNGLKPQPDEQVLVHTIRLWNKVHPGPSVTLTEGDPSYLGGLVNAALSIVQPSDTGIVSGRSLLINTGAANVPAKVIGLHLRGNTSATAPAGFAAMSTGSKVILVSAAVGGAALLGVGAYAAVKKKTIGAVLKGMVRR